ncbi:MAG: 4-hydroxy-tetrahydrodipicolinate reductase [Armatimonadetes bacterium]|nr:4-hydroxy-tetrahydrodipicolinate reductase [Armatimonadota bacterium]
MAIRVLVSGAGGKMGCEVVRAVNGAEGMEVVAAVDPGFAGQPLEAVCGVPGLDVTMAATLEEGMAADPEVMVDFTAPGVVKQNVLTGIDLGMRVVWGTTGLTPDEMEEVRRAVEAKGTAAFHAPNFAIGAVLLMVLSQKVARHMPALEIIEMHGEMKKDAPSGTAVRTAEMILEASELPDRPETEKVMVEGARGGAMGPVRIHSLRLPGYVAHQEVIFGGWGQTLTIRHDSMNRESFMPGVVLAVRKVREIIGLVVGLEHFLDLG